MFARILFFFLGLLYSLRRYDKLSWFQSFKQSLETCLYMMLLWVPLVTFIVFKIFLCKRDMNWGKTSHGLAQDSSKTKSSEEKISEKTENITANN